MSNGEMGISTVNMPSFRWTGMRSKYREQSPLYRFTQTNVAIGASFLTNLDRTPFWKYLPFNFLQVTNSTDQQLLIITDAGSVKAIPSNTILSFDSETLPAYRTVQIQNASGALATGDVEVICQKVKSYKDVRFRLTLVSFIVPVKIIIQVSQGGPAIF